MKKIFTNTKILGALVIATIVCVSLSACSDVPNETTYRIVSVELAPTGQQMNLVDFDLHKDSRYEFRFGDNQKLTASFIYFTVKEHEDGIYYDAGESHNDTTYRALDGKIIVEGAIVGAVAGGEGALSTCATPTGSGSMAGDGVAAGSFGGSLSGTSGETLVKSLSGVVAAGGGASFSASTGLSSGGAGGGAGEGAFSAS